MLLRTASVLSSAISDKKKELKMPAYLTQSTTTLRMLCRLCLEGNHSALELIVLMLLLPTLVIKEVTLLCIVVPMGPVLILPTSLPVAPPQRLKENRNIREIGGSGFIANG